MIFRVTFLCIVAACGTATASNGHYRIQKGSRSDSVWSRTSGDDLGSDDPADLNAFAYGRQKASLLDRAGSKFDAYEILNPRLHRSPSDRTPQTARNEDQNRSLETGNHGKSSYPSDAYDRRSDLSAMEFYTDLYSKQKDVEMILPNEKAIILPMVNGKPKPYDGYKVAPEVKRHKPRHSEDEEIIYGKPKEGVYSIMRPTKSKRSAAEYHGGIHPHFDYSDPKNAPRIMASPKETYKKRKNFNERRTENSESPRGYYKRPKESRRTIKKSNDEKEAEEEEAEEEQRFPSYNYHHDSSIPELKIKYYPYERLADERGDDSRGEDSNRDTYDEYTASYELYKKTLPTDLEKLFGSPDFGDYSVEASENLENNTNCEKLKKRTPENATEETKAAHDERTEVCYVCRDPATGGSYSRCAYKTKPKSEKYYYEGTSSFKEDSSPERVSYRHKRSSHDGFVNGSDRNVKQYNRRDAESGYLERPRKDMKKRHKNWRSDDEESYSSRDYYHGAPPSRAQRKSKRKEEPTESYDRPKYFYEDPHNAYEGPSESYDIPIHKEYYSSSDYGTENDEISPSSEEIYRKPKTAYNYNIYHPDTTPRRNHYEAEAARDDFEENYNLGRGYVADYRFGPEHFVDDEEVAEEVSKEEVESENRPKPSEKRPKHSEASRSGSAESEGRQDRNVKVFKNGDVCRKKKVGGMICMVCKNEKTADTYEQCQYSSKPKDKYYAYGSQKSYRTSDPSNDSKNEENEDQQQEKSDVIEKKIMITKQSKTFQDNSGILDTFLFPHGDLQGASSDKQENHLNESQNDPENGQESESIMRMEPRDGIEGLEEFLYSDSEDDDKATLEEREYKSYDDYFHDIFPEFSNRKSRNSHSEEEQEESEEDEEETEESESERHDIFDPFSNLRKFKQDSPDFLNEYSEEASSEEQIRLKDKRSRVPHGFFTDNSEDYHRKNMEKALGEFQNRDWSNCKKIIKNKLTCYQCVDENGVSNEECVFVEASQPIAHRERKELALKAQEVKNQDLAKERTKMRGPKNAMEETTTRPAPEVPSRRRPIGDFQGAEMMQEEDVMTPVPSITREAAVEESVGKPRMRNKQKTKTSKKATDATTKRML